MSQAANKVETANEDEIFLVDGSGYIFRAYFAMAKANMTNPEGTPVGAVYGFTNMLHKLLCDLDAPYLAVIFDAARANFRNDIYDQYKANRDDPPEDLIPQFPMFRETCEAFGIPAIEMEGYEADDLIATYCKLAVAKGKKVTIVGTDKDLMQLVNDDVRMYDPMKGVYIGYPEVEEKFGVTPDKVVDVQSLAGDPTDNIPGVPGIGIKTAAQLINEYGDLDTLLERAEEIKQQKRRESLIEHADNARMSRQLVKLADDVEVPFKLEDLKAHDPDTSKLVPYLKKQGFKSLLSRLGESTNDVPAPAAAAAQDDEPEKLPPVSKNEYTLVNDMNVLKEWIAKAHETGLLCVDTETTNLTPAKAKLVGICLSYEVGVGAYIPVGHVKEMDLLGDSSDDVPQLKLDDVIAALKPVLEDESVLKIAHNAKYDWQILKKHGIDMAPVDDTMLISYVVDGHTHGHGMDALSTEYIGHTPIKYEEVAGKGKNQVTFDKVSIPDALQYAAEDAEITMRLHGIFKPRLAQEHMVSVYEDIERPLVQVIGQMELNGIKVDPAILKKMSNDFAKKIVELEKKIQKQAGTEFNVGSPKQIGEILFEQMGLEGGKKTKTGQWSTDVDMLEMLGAQGHEIVNDILEWRGLSKLKSTYTDALQEQINPDTGRVHTSYHMTGTSTGRLASSDPNLQNIPIRSEDGRKIREAFVAEDGHVLLSVDYSQVELRLAAEMAGVEALQKAFADGVDIHALTASRVFGVDLDKVTPDLRRQAKAVNFGIIYGISGWGLAKQLGCDPKEANDFINRYLTTFHEIQTYMEDRKEEARKHGYVKTLYGRKCYTPFINAKIPAQKAGAERAAINAPLQGTAADIMKRAMIKIPPALEKAGLGAKMLLQVHDELIFEVPENELTETETLVKEIMENVANLSVPLIAEAGHGHSWADAH